jgi:hypothetical protein
MSKYERPRVSLIKGIKSTEGVVYDLKKSVRGRQFLVARGGDLSHPPTFNFNEQRENINKQQGINTSTQEDPNAD